MGVAGVSSGLELAFALAFFLSFILGWVLRWGYSGFNKINGFDDYLDQKQINISHFKQGMGTYMVPMFRGIKYRNIELFKHDIDVFQRKAIDFKTD